MKNPSLEGRLIKGISLTYVGTIIVVALVYLTASWTTHQIEIQDMTDELDQDISIALVRQADGTIEIDPGSAVGKRIRRWPDIGVVVEDTATGNRLLASGYVDPQIPSLDKSWELSGKFRNAAGELRIVSVHTHESRLGSVRITLVRGGANDSDLIDWIWGEIFDETLPVVIPLFLVSVGIIWLIVRRSMRPLRRASEQANQIGKSMDGNSRLSTEAIPAEVLPLITAANGALDRVKGMLQLQRRFTANAAHELRTPLAVLRAGIDNLTAGDSRQQLAAETDRLTRRVNQLLAMSRLENSQLQLQPIADLGKLAASVAARLVPVARKTGRDIVFIPGPHPIPVNGDEPSLEEAIANLIENALRHTSESTSVEITATDDNALEIKDSGAGIPAQELDRIFEPFWRGSSQMGEGAGLGLAIARETARLHGGDLTAVNNDGAGMTFRLWLPVLTAGSAARIG